MSKIHLIMPMAGGGTRFGNRGFDQPKPLIQLHGKPFFYWAVQSVIQFVEAADSIFVVLQEHVERYGIDRQIKQFYPSAVLQVIPRVLNGAVLTCCEGIKAVTDELPILFNDCDHAFYCEQFYDFCRREEFGEFGEIDGALLTFTSSNPNYSYVRFDDCGRVIGTVEKMAASSEAICGAYYFRNKQIFIRAVEAYRTKCAYQEFFVSGVYNELARSKQQIVTFPVNDHVSFGTPEEYEAAVADDRLGVLVR